MTTVRMNCPLCNWAADHAATARIQWDYLSEHLFYFHDQRRNPMAPTIIQQMWFKLDEFTKTAMEWSGPAKNAKPSPENADEWTTYLEDMVDKVSATAQGRGLAIAIEIACTPFFENSDQVVKLAVARYRAKIAGTELPDTPGFMGQVSGDALRVAATGKSGPAPAPKITAPAGPPQNSAAPVPDGIAEAIKGVAANGFDVATIAKTFSITETQVKQVLAEGNAA